MRAPSLPASCTALVLTIALAVLPSLAIATIDPSTAQKKPVPPPRYTGELLIQFRPGATAAVRDSILADLGIARASPLPGIRASRARPARVSVDEAIRRFRGHPAVEFIEPDVIVRTLGIPNDPNFRAMWALRNIGQTDGVPGADANVTPAWDRTTGSSSVLVAITDTGIDWRHPDLAPNLWINPREIASNGIDDDSNGFIDDVRGWDFANGDANPMDDVGHGTHVAGTIGAVGNNAIGVAGVSWHVRLMPLKFLDENGEGPLSDGIKAIDYAVHMGARIINASWGSNSPSEALRQAIERAGDAGVLVVAASGNDGVNNDGGDPYGPPNYPASFDLPNIISVGAFDFRQGMMWWSNYGPKSVDLCAPGVAILSTVLHGEYGPNTGTSMAAPHVAGVAALVFAAHPRADALEVKDLILAGVVPVPEWQGLTLTGGRLDAFRALGERDSVAPAGVTDLASTEVNGTRVTLRWTATGDDGLAGVARRYDLRMSTSPIDAGNFSDATRVGGLPATGPSGAAESFVVRRLDFGTVYYFALQSRDECGNSALSNIARVTTLTRPEIEVDATPLAASLFTNQTGSRTLTITNAGPSEMRVQLRTLQSWLAVAPPDTIIPAGTRLDARVRFDASGLRTADYSGTVHVMSDDVDETQLDVVATLHVTGIPDIDVDLDQAEFGDVLSGRMGGIPLTLRNRGSLPLHIAIVSNQAAFTISVASLVLEPDASKVVGIRFVPSEAMMYAGRLTITSDDPDQPILEIPLAGRGIAAPHAVVEPREFADTLRSWGTVARTLTLRNPQGSDLTFQITMEGNAWLSVTPAGGRIVAGDSALVSLTLTAADLPDSSYATVLQLSTNDPTTPWLEIPVRLEVRAAPDIVVAHPPRSVESAADYFFSPPVTQHDLVVSDHTRVDARAEAIFLGGYGGGFGRIEIEDVFEREIRLSLASCSSTHSEFRLSAAQFERLVVDGTVHASLTSGTPPNQLCRTDQHRFRLTWLPALEALDFGTAWIGRDESREVVIHNRGLRPLRVEPPAIAPPFSMDATTAFTLAPGDTATWSIRFHPGTPGPVEAILVIPSDDPDQPRVSVPVRGAGVPAPDAALSVTRFDSRLPAGGRGGERLTLTNRGGSELQFDVDVESGARSGSTTGAWVLLVQDTDPWDFWASDVNQYVLTNHGIRFMTLSSASLADVDLSLFTKIIIAGDQPTSAYRSIQAVMPKLADFVYRGGTLEFHTGFGWADGDASLITLPRGVGVEEVWGWINLVTDPTHPLMTGVSHPVIAWERSVNVSLAAFTHVPEDAERVVLDDADHPTLITYRHGAGTVLASGIVLELGWYRSWGQRPVMENLVPYLAAPRTDWVSFGPRSGHVPPAGSATVELGLDAAGLAPGTHDASIVLRTNDPAKPRITVPVHLALDDTPDIVVEGPAVEQETFQPFDGGGSRTTHTFPVAGLPGGDGILEVTPIGDFGERSEFATLKLEGSVIGQAGKSGQALVVPVSEALLDRAAADGRIEVEVLNTANVGTTAFPINEHRVRLTYPTGTHPLEYGRIYLGKCAEQRVQITNRGSADLHLAAPVASNAAFRVEPATGVMVLPGETRSLVVQFCPLTPGRVEARLTLRCDDPDQPGVDLGLAGEGEPPPRLALTPSGMSIALLRDETAERTLRLGNSGGTALDYRVEIESSDRNPSLARAPVATPISAAQQDHIRQRYQAFRDLRSVRSASRALTTRAVSSATALTRETALSMPAPGNATILFSDDMEHGESGWTHSATSSSGVDSWTPSSVRTASGRRSWQVTPHETEGTDALVSPVIDLSGHSQATLTFATWYSFDDCIGTPGYEPDGGVVEVSVEGSGVWTPVTPVNGYPFVLDETCLNPLAGRAAYAHQSADGDTFVTERIDLSPYAGQAIRIRFQAAWDCGNCDMPDGWFVDDVRVFTDAPKWVNAHPADGQIAPGDVGESAVTVLSAGLIPGLYRAELRVHGNDPDQPVIAVPFDLKVADLPAALDVPSNPVNLRGRGRWLTLSIELPRGDDAADILVPTIRLNDVVAPGLGSASLGDRDGDGIPDLSVRFAVDELRPTLDDISRASGGPGSGPGDEVPLVLTANVRDGRLVLGRATLRVLRPRLTFAGGAALAPRKAYRLSWTLPDEWEGTTVSLSFSGDGGIHWEAAASDLAGPSWNWTTPDRPVALGLLRAEFGDREGPLATVTIDRTFSIGRSNAPGEAHPSVVERLTLHSAPNPFAGGTDITLALPRPGIVELAAYSVTGQRLCTLLRGVHDAGTLSVRWEGRDARGARLPAGVYFLRLETPDGVTTRRVTLLR